MQRIITVTFHCAHNYGAVLQAYALQKYIENNYEDYYTACLDYRPPYLKNHLIVRNKNEGVIKAIFHNVIAFNSRYKRKRVFDRFICTHIRTIDGEDLDNVDTVFVVGSDQVWNKNITGNNIDPVYTLDFVSKARKASYAASVGTLDEALHEVVASKIRGFDKIGVREFESKLLLEKYGIHNVKVNVDPVFLLNKDDYAALAETVRDDDYILIYTLETNFEITKIIPQYRDKYKIVSIGSFRKIYGTDCHLSSLSPQKYLGIIQGAKHVITNSFHAVAFSIIFEKSFEYIPLKNGRGVRIENLLSLIKYNENSNNPCAWKELLANEINESKKWIEEIIKGR